MDLDPQRCYAAVCARDPRFDGWFTLAVTSTGIYCRPSCPARTPNAANARFYPSAAAAQQAGFRACRRCRPDAVPGPPPAALDDAVVARALTLIEDGVVDRAGVRGLADQLGYSTRQLQRRCVAELGAAPLALARAERARSARVLLETTDLPIAQVAFAAGFGSLRQCNETLAQIFAATPSQLRQAKATRGGAPSTLRLRLARRNPFDATHLFAHLVATAVPGVEAWTGTAYLRSVVLPHGPAVLSFEAKADSVELVARLADLRDLSAAVSRSRALLDLDADPEAIDTALGADPTLRPLIDRGGGARIPGTVDGAELALRAVLGQQVSTAAAATAAGRLTAVLGVPLEVPVGSVTHCFPTPGEVADAPDELLAMPARRRRTLRTLAAALADGRLNLSPGADPEAAIHQLRQIDGIGPWTLATISQRVLRDSDAFLAGDLGVRLAAEALGLPTSPAALERHSQAWRPWRSYAVQYLWRLGDHPINHLPQGPRP